MRAVQYDRFGGPEVLRLEQVPIPEPGPGQVRIAVEAAGVNAMDAKVRGGQFGTIPMPQRPGLDLAGTVEAVGDGAPALIGESVLGWPVTGAYADYAIAETVTDKPDPVPWNVAASLPVASEAAVRALRELAVRPGETLVIHGASGSTGELATQLAVSAGVNVVGTASRSNHDHLRQLGAIPVSHGKGLKERVGQVAARVDAALDATASGGVADLLTLPVRTGRMLTLSDPSGPQNGVHFSSRTPNSRDSVTLADVVARVVHGELSLRQAGSYPLSDADAAQREDAISPTRGKITLVMR